MSYLNDGVGNQPPDMPYGWLNNMQEGSHTREWWEDAEESVNNLREARERRENGFSGFDWTSEGARAQFSDEGLRKQYKDLSGPSDYRNRAPGESRLEWQMWVSEWNAKIRDPRVLRKDEERNTRAR